MRLTNCDTIILVLEKLTMSSSEIPASTHRFFYSSNTLVMISRHLRTKRN